MISGSRPLRLGLEFGQTLRAAVVLPGAPAPRRAHRLLGRALRALAAIAAAGGPQGDARRRARGRELGASDRKP